MAHFIACNYDQTQLVPVKLSEQLSLGTLEWAIHHILEERINLKPFIGRYNNADGGRVAYHPKVLLKIILLGYARGVTSSRGLERLCRENVVFMSLSCGQCPDHSTIAAFIVNLGDLAEKLFVSVLMICEEEGLLGGTHLSVDGTKLSSNASKEWSGTISDLKKKHHAIQEKVKTTIKQHQQKDAITSDEERRHHQRIQRLHASADRIASFLADAEPRIGAQGKEIQSNITDNESAKMSTSHGVRQGYNANALVDAQHQVIVAAEAFGRGGDQSNMEPILDKALVNFHRIGHAHTLKDIIISADTSYFSKVNLAACESFGVDAYIPDAQFRNRDVRFKNASRHRRKTLLDPTGKQRKKTGKSLFTKEDFELDPATGKLRCPAGELLYGNGGAVIKKNKKYRNFRSNPSSCRDCPLKSKCIRNPNGSTRQVCIPTGEEISTAPQRMRDKIDTLSGRETYSKRLGIVEPVFANICTHKRMDVLRHRGHRKVNIQWTLYCMVHNIGKLTRYGDLTKAA